MDIEGYCNDDDYVYNGYKFYWENFGNLPQFIRRYEEIVNGRYHSGIEDCINNAIQYVAIIHFHIAPSANDLINKIVKTPRVTYADILSNIGKYVMLSCMQLYDEITNQLSSASPLVTLFLVTFIQVSLITIHFIILQVEPWVCLQVLAFSASLKLFTGFIV